MRPRISIRGSVRPSVRRSVGWLVGRSVTRFFFGLLGATYAVYTTLFFMNVIREAQEHHRNVELHLYRKVGLLVCPSIRELR